MRQCEKILNISKSIRQLDRCLNQHLLYHFAQCVTSEVIQFDLSFTLYNVQVVPTNVMLLAASLAKMNVKECCEFLVM